MSTGSTVCQRQTERVYSEDYLSEDEEEEELHGEDEEYYDEEDYDDEEDEENEEETYEDDPSIMLPNRTLLHTCYDDPAVDCALLFKRNGGKGCVKHPEYMKSHCASTCHYCHLLLPSSISTDVTSLMTQVRDRMHAPVADEKEKNETQVDLSVANVVSVWIPSSYGVDQRVMLLSSPQALPAGSDSRYDSPTVLATLHKMHEYMWNTVYSEPKKYDKFIRETCRNDNVECTFWASIGECTKNPSYMERNCAPACQTCHKLLFEHRCPYNASDPEAPQSVWTKPTDLDNMFQRAVALYHENITLLSKPANIAVSAVTMSNVPPFDGPWVLTIDDFLTAHECERLIQLGHDIGYERSKDVGERKPDGSYTSVESKSRTSGTAWCKADTE
jgi:ShK domain-like